MTSCRRIKSNRIRILNLIVVMLLFATTAYAAEVDSINVRGATIRINDIAEQVAEVLTEQDVVDQVIKRDPVNPRKFSIIKNYKVMGKKFSLHFAKEQIGGPYTVIKITTD